MGFQRMLKNDYQSGHPTAGVSAEWLNTVANIFNDLEGIGCHIEKKIGTRGMGWKIVVGDGTGDIEPAYRFKVIQASETTLRVMEGTWYRNSGDYENTGNQMYSVDLTVDAGKDYKTLTASGTSTTHYVYVMLNQAINPTGLTAHIDTYANMDEDLIPDSRWVLAAVDLNASGYITNIEQLWRGGDIIQAPLRIDGASLGWLAGSNQNYLEIRGWAGASETPASGDKFVYADVDDSNNADYVTLSDLATAIGNEGGFLTSESWLDLTDTDPASYTSQAGKYVRVNSTPDGLEFTDEIHPARESQAAQPTPTVGELLLWRDTDDDKTYLVYNDTDVGVRQVELT